MYLRAKELNMSKLLVRAMVCGVYCVSALLIQKLERVWIENRKSGILRCLYELRDLV
jgi:hypothetical protein